MHGRAVELVAAAKDWDTEKQLSIAPTLLRGKLVDIYVDFDTETKSDLQLLKDTLMKRAGLDSDSLMIGKEFMSCSQLPNEKVEDFLMRLKKLFRQAYVKEDVNSDVLLLSAIPYWATASH